MSKDNIFFSSKKQCWETPQNLFDKLDSIFHFDIDVCASKENAKCKKFFTEKDDLFSQEIKPGSVCFMNPPYGNGERECVDPDKCKKEKCRDRGYHQVGNIPGIYEFVKFAYNESKENNCTFVCLIPAKTETKLWQRYAVKGEIFFIEGRLKFSGSKSPAPFASAIVVFRPKIGDVLKGYHAN